MRASCLCIFFLEIIAFLLPTLVYRAFGMHASFAVSMLLFVIHKLHVQKRWSDKKIQMGCASLDQGNPQNV